MKTGRNPRKKKLLTRSQRNNIKNRILKKEDKSDNSDSSTDEETDEEECHVCGGTGSSSCHLDEKCRNCNN